MALCNIGENYVRDVITTIVSTIQSYVRTIGNDDNFHNEINNDNTRRLRIILRDGLQYIEK